MSKKYSQDFVFVYDIPNHWYNLRLIFLSGNESENSVGKEEVLKKYSAVMFAIVYEKTNDAANTVTTQALKVLGKNLCNL